MRVTATVLLVSLFFSCATIRETHYFKDKIDSNGNTSINSSVSNYYKVNIKGWAFLSSSRYVSGYFDEDVVNEYFNEISQPENGRLFSLGTEEEIEQPKPEKPTGSNVAPEQKPEDKEGETQAEESSVSGVVESGNKKNKKSSSLKNTETGSELVLILSTNAEAIATEIKNTAANKDVLKSLALLANKEKIEKTKELQSASKNVDSDIDLFVLKIDAYMNSIESTSPTDNDKQILFQILKSELKEQGVTRAFTDYNDLKDWYYENN